MDSNGDRGGVPLHEAAERLGVGVELLRKRAQRNTIPAYKQDGRWFVVLDTVQDNEAGPVQDNPSRTRAGQDVQDSVSGAGRAVTVSPAAYAQLQAIRDEWLQPLVAQIR